MLNPTTYHDALMSIGFERIPLWVVSDGESYICAAFIIIIRTESGNLSAFSVFIPMMNEFSEYIARRLCRIAALQLESHMNYDDLRIAPCSATNSMHSQHSKSHPS